VFSAVFFISILESDIGPFSMVGECSDSEYLLVRQPENSALQ